MSGAQSYTNKMALKVLGMTGVCHVERASLGMYKVKVLACRSLQVRVGVWGGGKGVITLLHSNFCSDVT